MSLLLTPQIMGGNLEISNPPVPRMIPTGTHGNKAPKRIVAMCKYLFLPAAPNDRA